MTEKSAVQFTIFLAEQSFGYGEDIGIAIGGTFDEQTGLRVGGDSKTASSSIGVRAYHFVPRLGWLHRINSQWAIGVMLQTPGIPLKQKGDVLRRITTDEPTFFLFDSGDRKAKMPIPFELRAGFGFQIDEEPPTSPRRGCRFLQTHTSDTRGHHSLRCRCHLGRQEGSQGGPREAEGEGAKAGKERRGRRGRH